MISIGRTTYDIKLTALANEKVRCEQIIRRKFYVEEVNIGNVDSCTGFVHGGMFRWQR